MAFRKMTLAALAALLFSPAFAEDSSAAEAVAPSESAAAADSSDSSGAEVAPDSAGSGKSSGSARAPLLSRTPRGAQELVPAGHWVYDAAREVALSAGLVNFADSAPLTIQELRFYLSEVDESRLSDSALEQLRRIEGWAEEANLSFASGPLSIGLEPSVSVEAFYKGEPDVPWVFDRYSRRPFIDAPATIGAGDYVTMQMDVFLGQSKGASLHNFNWTNVPLSADDIDINFPDTGYLSAGTMLGEGAGVGLQVGRGSRSVGATETGSIIWSDALTGVSYAQLSLFSRNFRYAGSISQFNVDKYLYAHTIEARLFGKFQITFLEGLLVNAPMELRYMNPWTIFHGFAAWREYEPDEDDPESHTCDYFGVKVQFTPVSNVRLYGLFAMTQFQTPYETTKFPDSPTPNGLGGQVGGEWFVPCGGGRFRFGLEGCWADPYLYIKESPNWSMVRTYSENMGDKAIFYEWLGSPFGPDTVSAALSAGYEVPGRWSVNLSYLFMARGELSGTDAFDRMKDRKGETLWGGQRTRFETDEAKNGGANEDYLGQWAYPDRTQDNWKERRDMGFPSGTPELVNRLAVRGSLRATRAITLTAQPAFVAVSNWRHNSGETRTGLEVAFAVDINILKAVAK